MKVEFTFADVVDVFKIERRIMRVGVDSVFCEKYVQPERAIVQDTLHKTLLGVIGGILSATLTEGKRTSNSWATATEFQSPKVIFPQMNFGKSLSCSLSQLDVAKTSPLGEVDMYT